MTKTKVFICLVLFCLTVSSCGFKQGYDDALRESRESGLRLMLQQLRDVINQYAVDNNALPQALEDLVRAGYINELPDDPITEKKDWKSVIGENVNLKRPKGIVDVRSSSTAKSSKGNPYSEW